MKVSDMTVRRDLIELENQGKLTRVFGGAKSNGGPTISRAAT